MDRSRRRSSLLIGVAAGLAIAVASDLVLAAAPALRERRWLVPTADTARILSHRPLECLTRPATAEGQYLVEVGRAAFRDPLILGGQAARAGVACETCHRNGRTNHDFFFPGVSGEPGTADVTSFVFSTHRGDHLSDPRPIPDLGGSKARLKVDQSPRSAALETFIHGLITEEFDGHEPPRAVLAGLAAYVRALDPGACSAKTDEAVTALGAWNDVVRAAEVARLAFERRDPTTAAVMLQAARGSLEALSERYAGPSLASQRERLTEAARQLGEINSAPALEAWSRRALGWSTGVLAAAPRSLYDPGRLAKALRSSTPPRHVAAQ